MSDREALTRAILDLMAEQEGRAPASQQALHGLDEEALRRLLDGLSRFKAEGARHRDSLPAEAREEMARGMARVTTAFWDARTALDEISGRRSARMTARAEVSAPELPTEQRAGLERAHLDELKELVTIVAPVYPQAADFAGEIREETESPGLYAQRGSPHRRMSTGRFVATGPAERFRARLSTILRHPIKWADERDIDVRAMTDAIARVENHMLMEPPATLVAVNEEGLGLARLINHDMDFNLPIQLIEGSAEQALHWHTAETLAPNARVLVIGHVAWSGATLSKAVEMTRLRFRTAFVEAAVLASSADAVQRISGHDHLAYHTLTRGKNFGLAGDPARLDICGKDFTFGSDTAARVVITARALALSRARLMQDGNSGAV